MSSLVVLGYVALFHFILAPAVPAQAAENSSLRVKHREGLVEFNNGLVKARFIASKDGVKQEYFAARGKEWILLAEDFKPGIEVS